MEFIMSKKNIYLSICLSIVVLFSCFVGLLFCIFNNNSTTNLVDSSIYSIESNTSDSNYSSIDSETNRNIDKGSRYMYDDFFTMYPQKYNHAYVGDQVVLEAATDLGENEQLQWFESNSGFQASNDNTLLEGETSRIFYPPTNVVGTKYYYCAYFWDGYVQTSHIQVNVYPQGQPLPEQVYHVSLNAWEGYYSHEVAVEVEYGQSMPSAPAPKGRRRFLGYYDRRMVIEVGRSEKANKDAVQYYDKDMNSVRDWDRTKDFMLWGWYDFSTSIVFVKLFANGGISGTDEIIADFGYPMPEAHAPMWKGYDFKGYADVDGNYYYDKDMNSVRNWDQKGANNATFKRVWLYAQWEEKPVVQDKFDITLDFNGGSGGTNQVVVGFGESMPTAIAPTRDGYIFGGYTDDINGGKRYYDENMESVSLWDKENDCTLYAQWQEEGIQPPLPEEKYTVILNFNGGSDGTSQVDVQLGENMPQAIAPIRDGYIFKGYYDRVDGGKGYYDDSMNSMSVYDKKEDSTLYARWDKTGVTLPPPTDTPTDTVSPVSPSSGNFGEVFGWSVLSVFLVAVVASGIFVMLKRKKNTKRTQSGYYNNQNYSNTKNYYNRDNGWY